MEAQASISVVLVDDHHLFRRGLKRVLEDAGLRVVAEAASGESSLAAVRAARPDVVVMDLNMPGMSGMEATRRLRAELPECAVLVLTVVADVTEVVDALLAGAVGYVLKDAAPETIVAAIRAAHSGDAHLSPRVAAMLVERIRERGANVSPAPDPDLTGRELEVLARVAAGADNGQIATDLMISVNTVKNHVSSILRKLGVENRIQAAVWAVERGLL